jgi:hypothetical protein
MEPSPTDGEANQSFKKGSAEGTPFLACLLCFGALGGLGGAFFEGAMAVISIDPIPTARQRFDQCERCGLRRWLGERVTERWAVEAIL